MKNLTIIIILLLSIEVSAQKSVKKYYRYINKAELSICNNDLQMSTKYYDKAFKQLKSPFVRDIKNAFLCEFYGNRDQSQLIKLSILLKKKGVSLNTIVDSVGRDSCYSRLLAIQDTVNTIYNLTLSSIIDSLIQVDQASRKKCPAYQDSCKAMVILNDSLILNSIIKLHAQYGGFTEDNIGFNSMKYYIIIVLHEQAWQWYFLRELHQQQVHQGVFDARTFAWLEDRAFSDPKSTSNKSSLYGSIEQLVISNTLFLCLSTKDKKIFNARRKKLYLESMEDLERKTIYQLLTKCKFNLNPGIVKFHFPEESEYAKGLIEKIDQGIINGKYYILK